MKVTRMGGGVQEEENRSSDEAAPSVVDAFREFREMLKDSETIDEFVNKNRLGEIDYEAANRRDPGYGVIIAGMSLFFIGMGGGLMMTRRKAKGPIEPDAVRLASKALFQATCIVGGSATVAVYATSKIMGVRSWREFGEKMRLNMPQSPTLVELQESSAGNEHEKHEE